MNNKNFVVRAISPAFCRLSAEQLARQFAPRTKLFAPAGGEPSQGPVVISLVGEIHKAMCLQLIEEVNQFSASTQDRLLIYVDSPGGDSANVDELAEAVRRASERKRVVAYADNFCASGAFYAVSNASEIVASRTSAVGSIGTYVLVADTSRMHEMQGIDLFLVRSGKFKGSGTHGVKIVPEELHEIQKYVDAINRHFLATVARGRRMDARRLTEIANGGLFVGEEALAVGLIDRVALFGDILAELTSAPKPRGQFSDLTGEAAYQKWESLACAEAGEDYLGFVEDATLRRLREKYPSLAAAAAAHEKINFVRR